MRRVGVARVPVGHGWGLARLPLPRNRPSPEPLRRRGAGRGHAAQARAGRSIGRRGTPASLYRSPRARPRLCRRPCWWHATCDGRPSRSARRRRSSVTSRVSKARRRARPRTPSTGAAERRAEGARGRRPDIAIATLREAGEPATSPQAPMRRRTRPHPPRWRDLLPIAVHTSSPLPIRYHPRPRWHPPAARRPPTASCPPPPPR